MNMNNSDTIKKFYTSFANGDAKGMIECYHENVVFQDPVFGTLKGLRAHKMWEMLLSNKKASAKISYSGIKSTNENGQAKWIAEYLYGEKKRPVINKVSAAFKFKDGKIIEHIDTFDLWKWTRQAMGIVGVLMGWTPMIKSKIQKTVHTRLDKFIDKGH